MVRESVFIKSIKFLFREIIFDIFYWPIWWYSSGVKKAVKRFYNTLTQANEELALGIWVKNILKPMYGQYSWDGRIISFFMRLVQIIIRSIIFLLWLVLAIAGFLIWLALPIILFVLILFSLSVF